MVNGFGDQGPSGWRCRAHQLQPLLDLVTPGKPVACDREGLKLDGRVGDENRGLGRVSVTNENNEIIYDTFVYYPADVPHRPDPQWLCLGVKYPDIEPENGAQPHKEVLENVQTIFNKSGLVIGHAFPNDRKMLRGISFNNIQIRDTQLLPEYITYAKDKQPSLADLSKHILKRKIQTDPNGHSSVEDAQATMQLYLARREDFERQQGAQALSAPVVDTAPSPDSASHSRDSSDTSSNAVTTSSATTDSTLQPEQAGAIDTVIRNLAGAGKPVRARADTGANTAARRVALPNIAAFAKGRIFDYRTSRYL